LTAVKKIIVIEPIIAPRNLSPRGVQRRPGRRKLCHGNHRGAKI